MIRSVKILALTLTLLTLAAGCRSMTGQSLGTIVDDQTTHSAIKSKLAAEKLKTLTWVGVDVENGIVTLTGNVDSEIMKQRAENIARSTPGVRGVVNTLLVTPGGVEHAQEVRPPAQAGVQPSAQPAAGPQAVAQQQRAVAESGGQPPAQQRDTDQPSAQPRAEMDPSASPASRQVLARQTVNAEITDVDLATGRVRLTTPEGRMDLNVPPETARGMHAGDRLTVEMIIRSAR